MIHLIIAESKKGYDWFEKNFDKNKNLFYCKNSIGSRNHFSPEEDLVFLYPEIHNSVPRTEKEIMIFMEKNFVEFLEISKDKILYIFTTSEQVFHFFRIRVAKQEMKCEDLKVSFIEEFFYDLGDGKKDDFNEIKMITLPGGYFDGWSNKMFGQTAHDLGELVRARRATIVPATASEKSSTAP